MMIAATERRELWGDTQGVRQPPEAARPSAQGVFLIPLLDCPSDTGRVLLKKFSSKYVDDNNGG